MPEHDAQDRDIKLANLKNELLDADLQMSHPEMHARIVSLRSKKDNLTSSDEDELFRLASKVVQLQNEGAIRTDSELDKDARKMMGYYTQ